MTRMTFAEIRPLSVEQAIAAARDELAAFEADHDRDHLANATALLATATNRSPRPTPPAAPRRRTVNNAHWLPEGDAA